MKNNINQDTTQPKQPQRRFRFLDRNCDSSSTSHGFLTGAHQFRRYSFHPHPPLHFLTIIFLFDIFVMPLLLVIAAQSWPAGINRAAQLVPSIDNTNDNNGEQAGRTKKEGGGAPCVKYVDRSKFSSHIQRQSLGILLPPGKSRPGKLGLPSSAVLRLR